MKKNRALLFAIGAITSVLLSINSLYGEEIVKNAMIHLPPFMIVDGNNPQDCINIRILEEIVKPLNLKVKYQIRPFKRCLKNMEVGDCDIFMGILRRPEREEYMLFLTPYKDKSNKAFYLKKGEGHRVQKYEDLYNLNKRIGVRLGLIYFERFNNDTKIKRDSVVENKINLDKLLADRIDAFIMTEAVADYLIITGGYGDKIEKAPYKYDKENPAYLAISKKSPFINRAKEFDDSIKNLRSQGRIQEIMNNYFIELEEKFRESRTN